VGSFPHISADWVVKYDLTLPPLSRLLSVSYLGKSLDLTLESDINTCYLVGISDFYVEKGGDSVDAFTAQEIVADHKELISDCVVEYLRTCIEALDGEPPGRFICVTSHGQC
jgi:hypothetical protein